MKNEIPRIVEVVGVAGVGKTTLCRALSRGNGIAQLGNFPDVRKISNMPFFVRYGFQTSLMLFNLPQHNSRKLTRREFAWLSILNGWPDILQEELKNNKTIILDQGPVYLLAEVSEFGPEFLKKQEAEYLWRNLYSRWICRLDVIVWLNATDDDLLERIRGRDKGHVIKNESVEATFQFLACYRKAYERIISDLSAYHPGLKIFRFDTSRKSMEEIVNQLLLDFNLA